MKTEISIFKKVESLVPAEIFKSGGIQPILDAIAKEISAEVPDTSTDKGRKAIASNAAKVSKSKTLLDKMGKELTDKLNLAIKPINAERRLARETLDELRDATRQPLTDYEKAEQDKAIAKFQAEEAKKAAEQLENDHEFGLLMNEKFDNDRMAAEKEAERQRAVQEATALKAKEENEKRISEQAAKEERERAAKAIKDAEQATKDAERAAKEQEEANKQALIDQQKAAEQREADAKAMAEQDKQKAIEAEQRRQRDAEEAETAAIAKREANKKHNAKINNEALACFEKGGLSKADAKLAVELIAKKMIANVVINY